MILWRVLSLHSENSDFMSLGRFISDTDETLVSSRVSRDSRVSVSVSDSYNAFLQSRSQSQSRIRSFTFDDVTGRESLCSKVSVSVSSLEIF